MKKRLTILTAFFLSFSAGAQSITYETWQAAAAADKRLLPEYGNLKKSDAEQEADAEFIDESTVKSGTREKASAEMILLGFTRLARGDLKTAMYRFNQAWLLDPKNENAYNGFGGVLFMFDDYDAALAQFEKGLKLNPNSAPLLANKGAVYAAWFSSGHVQANLDRAIALLSEAAKIDPKDQTTLYRLSRCYYQNHDCPNAVRCYDACVALGGLPVTNEYSRAIKRCR